MLNQSAEDDLMLWKLLGEHDIASEFQKKVIKFRSMWRRSREKNNSSPVKVQSQ